MNFTTKSILEIEKSHQTSFWSCHIFSTCKPGIKPALKKYQRFWLSLTKKDHHLIDMNEKRDTSYLILEKETCWMKYRMISDVFFENSLKKSHPTNAFRLGYAMHYLHTGYTARMARILGVNFYLDLLSFAAATTSIPLCLSLWVLLKQTFSPFLDLNIFCMWVRKRQSNKWLVGGMRFFGASKDLDLAWITNLCPLNIW